MCWITLCGHCRVPVKRALTKFQVHVSLTGRVEKKRNHRGILWRYLHALHAVTGICFNTGAVGAGA